MSLFHTNTLIGSSGSGSDPTYVDDVFSCDLYQGSDPTAKTITSGIDLSGEGGLVWTKKRNAETAHFLFDTVRGGSKSLNTGSSDGEGTDTNGLTFNSDGHTVRGNFANINGQNQTYVSWTFRKAPGFFDIVTYTGNGSNRTISHNLGSTPGFMMVKRTSSSEDWTCFHRSMGGTKWVQMNGTSYLSEQTLSTIWNNTAPDASVFSVGTHDRVNTNGETYIAYLFAHDAQNFGDDSDEAIIKCDTVTISGSGTFDVNNLGFEPQFVIFKQINGGMTTPEWYMHDNMRGLVQRNWNPLLAGKPDGESSNSYYYNEGIFTVNPQGFKSILSNHNAGDYIYIAIRRPHKPPTAGTDVFKAVTYSGSSSAQTITGAGFAPDWMWSKDRSAANNGWHHDRLRGVYSLDSSGSGGEQDRISYVAQPPFTSDGVKFITGGFDLNRNNSNHIAYFFKRAPGFFDIVAYTGDGASSRDVTHSLGSAPHLVVVKRRNTTGNWTVWSEDLSNNHILQWNGTDAEISVGTGYINSSTTTTFNIGNDSDVNASGSTYIAYLFDTLAGISKVGTYSGTGNDVNVDCGFTSGARFVLIRRIDSTSNWYVYDSARGIVSGNDSYLLLNTTGSETAPGDYIDPLNSGFTVTSNADFNVSGGTYLFLAVA